MADDTGPGGYVVITFGNAEPDWCTWPRCPMGVAEWFPDDESARRYMAELPRWTDPHRLTVSDYAYVRQQRRPPAAPREETST